MSGFSLVESLIVTLLSAILLLILLQFLFYFRSTHKKIEQYIDRQEKTRLLSNTLKQAESSAGYIGCRRLSKSFSMGQVKGLEINAGNAKQIFSANQAPNFISAKPIGEVKVFRNMSTYTAQLIKMPEKNKVIVSYLPTFKIGELIVLADCRRADIVSVTNVNRLAKKKEQILNLSRTLKFKYHQGQVAPLMIKAFYESKNSRGKVGFYEDVLGRGRREILER